MVYKGTNVTRGKGVVVVTGTGMATEVGGIARELAATEETRTPLQDELNELGRTLGLGVLGLSALVAPLLLVRGTTAVQAALTAVSLAVAAIPEGLPAVVTLTLALGVRKMSEENALVRRLPAVEALGAVDVVCTDKTGTLTKGQMTVSKLWVNDAVIDVDSADTDADVRADRTELLLRIGAPVTIRRSRTTAAIPPNWRCSRRPMAADSTSTGSGPTIHGPTRYRSPPNTSGWGPSTTTSATSKVRRRS